MKNTELYKYVYHFSVDYDRIDVEDILDIRKYLMIKNNIWKNCNFFIGLLNIFTLVRFSKSLYSYYKKPIKCVTLNNRPCQARQTRVD